MWSFGAPISSRLSTSTEYSEASSLDDGANIPLALQGASRLVITYDATSHRIGIAPTDLPGGATTADKAQPTAVTRVISTWPLARRTMRSPSVMRSVAPVATTVQK